jgi:four helix bundle protein
LHELQSPSGWTWQDLQQAPGPFEENGRKRNRGSGTEPATGNGMASNGSRDLRARAFELAKRVFELFPDLVRTGPAHAYLARQLLRSASSVGANLDEGVAASSRRDMCHRYSIALRESRESRYWARLGAIDPRWTARLAAIAQESQEFVAMLTSAVRKLRQPAPSVALRVRHSANFKRSARVRPRRRG